MRYRIEGTYTRGGSRGPWSIDAVNADDARTQAEALGIEVNSIEAIPGTEEVQPQQVQLDSGPDDFGFGDTILRLAPIIAVACCVLVPILAIAQIVVVAEGQPLRTWFVFALLTAGSAFVSLVLLAALACVCSRSCWLVNQVRQQQERLDRLGEELADLRGQSSGRGVPRPEGIRLPHSPL